MLQRESRIIMQTTTLFVQMVTNEIDRLLYWWPQVALPTLVELPNTCMFIRHGNQNAKTFTPLHQREFAILSTCSNKDCPFDTNCHILSHRTTPVLKNWTLWRKIFTILCWKWKVRKHERSNSLIPFIKSSLFRRNYYKIWFNNEKGLKKTKTRERKKFVWAL